VTMADPRVVATCTSARWEGPVPGVTALVSTYDRAAYLPELVAALEAQDLPPDEFEVVLVDNGSTDGTWDELCRLVQATPLRAAAVRIATNHGPAAGRNTGARAGRAPLLAITDDDCLPTPGWLRNVELAFAGGADVVQGTVHGEPAGLAARGPWDHTIWVTAPTPFFETSNVAYRRSAFDRAGGFDEDDPLLHPPSGRAFGEDAALAWEVQRTGGTAAFSTGALVHHRCVPSTYGRFLADQRHLGGFPGLARRSPLVARWLYLGMFLERRTALVDLGLLGIVVAVVLRWPWPALLALPWLVTRWGNARHRTRGARSAAVGVWVRLLWADLVGFGSLLWGSIRHRRPVL
jgi:cellulose synthase/poly-beta-1,6-N-acetylglucosamine synthase-like glycosyltransferase